MSDLIGEEAPRRLHHIVERPARSYPFGPLTGASQLLVNGAGLWVGHAIEETTGLAAARCVIGDGSLAAVSNLLAPVTLAANESRLDMLGPFGVAFYRGVVVQATVGTVSGAVWVIELDRDELDYILRSRTGMGR